MSWKRVTISIFLVVIFLNIIQLNLFLIYVYNSQPETDDMSLEIIPYIWYGEVFLGLAIVAVILYTFLVPKKRKAPLTYEIAERKPTGDVKITPSIGYNGASLFYEVTVNNRTAFPLSDVIITPYLSKDKFILEVDKKSIPVVRPYDSDSVKFSLMPKFEEEVEADVLGRVNYYTPGIDEYEEHLLTPRNIKISWPALKPLVIENEEWGKVKNELLNAEETISDIPLTGENCTDFTLDLVQDKAYMVSSETIENATYKSITEFYARDKEDGNYGIELIVTAKKKNEKPSQLKIVLYAEKKDSLVGLYYLIFHDVNQGIKKREEEIKTAEKKITGVPEIPPQVVGPARDIYQEFDILRQRVETIEKDKIGIDAKFKSLYELDELYKILAEDLVKRKIVDIKAGEEIVKRKLTKKQLEELKRFKGAYELLCEAETSDTVLTRKDFPNSGKKAIMLVYFNAVEVYVRDRLKELIPKGVTLLLGENHGHINTRKKDWEKSWDVLSLGSCIHIINHNGYLFLKNEKLWKENIETLMHQVRELRNQVAHPSKENPDPRLVREKVYKLLRELPDVLKSNE